MRSLLTLLVLVTLPAASHAADPPAAERGHGLSADDVRAGWISLFDGESTSGWIGATIRGEHKRLAGGSCVRPVLTPLPVTPETWKVIHHPTLPAGRQTKWETVERDGKTIGVRAVGGPGCLELPGAYGDFVLQLEVNCRAPRSNAGVFFRARPGDFLNGYEVQILNPRDGEARRPKYVTGAIDDRQPARRAVARDGEPFVLTVVAAGPKMATWVNGVQVVDWTDARPAHDNPRRGLRLEPGTIQLQAHDRDTDVEFTNFRVAPLK